MLTPNVLQRLRGERTLRRYYQMLQERVQQEPAIQLLPALLDLPLVLEGRGGTLAGMLMQHAWIALGGGPGSGRTLALLQLLQQWLTADHREPIFLLSLAREDLPDQTPRTVLEQAFTTTGLPAKFNGLTRIAPRPSCVLLFDAWETLPSSRRIDWRNFLLLLPQIWPEARIVVTLPESGEQWPGFQEARLAAPDASRCQAWCTHLLPHYNAEPLINALLPGGSLAALGTRLQDIALCALTYPVYGLPTSRAQLYEQADTIGTTHGMSDQSHHVGWSVLRCYEMARHLTHTPDLSPLSHLETLERAEVALALIGMLPDPERLYAELWSNDRPSPDNLLILGRCMNESTITSPVWYLRVLDVLCAHQQSQQHETLLHTLIAALPTVIVTYGSTLPAELTSRVLLKLAPLLGESMLLTIVDDTNLRADLRWAAADALIQLSAWAYADLPTFSHPPDALARVARCALLIAADPAQWQASEALIHTWIDALNSAEVCQQRRARVANALLRNERVPIALQSAVLAVTPQTDTHTALTILAQACTDSNPDVRHDALRLLRQHPEPQALMVLTNVLTTATWPAQSDALQQLAEYTGTAASTLLARCALSSTLPLLGRFQSLHMLAQRRGVGSLLLRRLLQVEAAHPAVRALAARLLGIQREKLAIGELCRLAGSRIPSLVRQEAATALGWLGQFADLQADACTTLNTLIQNDVVDVELTICAVRALGVMGATRNVPTLGALLNTDMAARLRNAWLSCVPDLAVIPVNKWPDLDLPDAMRTTLLTALAHGDTDADQPGSMEEWARWEASQVRIAVIQALTDIAQRVDRESCETIRAILMAVLRSIPPGQETERILSGVMQMGDAGEAVDLVHLLYDDTLDVMIRWQVVEQLGTNPLALSALMTYLDQAHPDPFIGSKVVAIMGEQQVLAALPILRRLSEQSDGAPHLRTQAMAALGMIGTPAAELALFHIVVNVTVPPALRAAAAAALPAQLHAEFQEPLRKLISHERLAPELLAELIRALGRTHDRHSLPHFLRYIHDDNPTVALAALGAIAATSDSSLAPLVVRLAQNGSTDQRVRMGAIGVLLHLCGTEYLPLLRGYLSRPALSLHMQAYDYLFSLQPDDPVITALLTDESAPLAVRLHAAEAVARNRGKNGGPDSAGADHRADLLDNQATHSGVSLLQTVLLNPATHPQLRIHIATLLEAYDAPWVIDTLYNCAQEMATPLRVRYRCLMVLKALAVSRRSCCLAARLALSQIADNLSQPAENQDWAAYALVHAEI